MGQGEAEEAGITLGVASGRPERSAGYFTCSLLPRGPRHSTYTSCAYGQAT
jgi:hypothetical protein